MFFDLTTWYIVGILVVLSTIWMAYDAHQHQVPIDNKPYGINNGAAAWFLSGILLWIATFPYYLVRRSAVVGSGALQQSGSPTSAKLAELNDMYVKNLITKEEFESKKKELLQRM